MKYTLNTLDLFLVSENNEQINYIQLIYSILFYESNVDRIHWSYRKERTCTGAHLLCVQLMKGGGYRNNA